ncbi:MAG: pyridoxal 5'-phosphate synthase glutaminase subunit PdxT [Thermoplasmatota archaeon]
MPLVVGVLAVQGAVSEHVDALHRAALALGLDVEVVEVRTAAELDRVQGLILPGGESTAMSRLLASAHMEGPLKERGEGGKLALFGTCAGMILLCGGPRAELEAKGIHPLGLLDAEVDRNAFGRQRDSFEADVEVAGVGRVPAVFIRAPAITRAWGKTEVLATHDGRTVAVRKGRLLATAFHPELTGDTRLHEWFLRLCQ